MGEVPYRSCAIVTTAANATVAPVHDRMPAILGDDSWRRWLDPAPCEVSRLMALLGPAPAEMLEMYPVSKRVNSVKNDGEELLLRLA